MSRGVKLVLNKPDKLDALAARRLACQRCGEHAVETHAITLWSKPLNRDVTVQRATCTLCGAVQRNGVLDRKD